MFRIDKTLSIQVTPFTKHIDELILAEVEKLTHARIFSVDYKEIKNKDCRVRKFHVISARNERDK